MNTLKVEKVRGTQWRIRIEGPDGMWRWSGNLGKTEPTGKRLEEATRTLALEVHAELVEKAKAAEKLARDWAKAVNAWNEGVDG